MLEGTLSFGCSGWLVAERCMTEPAEPS